MLALTPSQMFKAGFLLRCADEGLSEAETAGRMQAAHQLTLQCEKQGLFEGAATALTGLIKNLGLLGIVAGGLAGGAGGYAVGSAMADPAQPEDVKRQELIAAYQQHADRIRRQGARAQYRPAQLRKPSFTGG